MRRRASSRDGEFGLRPPDSRLVKAVQDLGGRVTKADVLAEGVAASGLERQLLELARASGASLQVSDSGELLFEFPGDLQGELRKRSAAARLQQAWRRAAPWLGYTGRMLFGASLLATVAILYSAVLIMMSTRTEGDRSGSGGGGRIVSQNTFNMWFGQDMFFWLMPRPYGYTYYGYGLYGYSFPSEPPPKMSFFNAVFSFVFGDGDPNVRLRSDMRWRLLGERIAQNGGSVVAEQIAPYLDPPDVMPLDQAARRRALDRAILPVLLRFRGEAKVSDSGDLVYVFPELQESSAAGELLLADTPTVELKRQLERFGRPTSAVERRDIVAEYRQVTEQLRCRSGEAPSYLKEKELEFSQAEDSQVGACAAYGGFALLATLYLGSNILSGKAQILAKYYPVMALVVKGFPLLLAYTTAFLGIPALRWLRLQRANAEIAERNAWRSDQAAQLRRPSGSLRERIRSAAKWAMRRGPFRSVFDSSKSVSEQSPTQDLEDFDRRLKGR